MGNVFLRLRGFQYKPSMTHTKTQPIPSTARNTNNSVADLSEIRVHEALYAESPLHAVMVLPIKPQKHRVQL